MNISKAIPSITASVLLLFLALLSISILPTRCRKPRDYSQELESRIEASGADLQLLVSDDLLNSYQEAMSGDHIELDKPLLSYASLEMKSSVNSVIERLRGVDVSVGIAYPGGPHPVFNFSTPEDDFLAYIRPQTASEDEWGAACKYIRSNSHSNLKWHLIVGGKLLVRQAAPRM